MIKKEISGNIASISFQDITFVYADNAWLHIYTNVGAISIHVFKNELNDLSNILLRFKDSKDDGEISLGCGDIICALSLPGSPERNDDFTIEFSVGSLVIFLVLSRNDFAELMSFLKEISKK